MVAHSVLLKSLLIFLWTKGWPTARFEITLEHFYHEKRNNEATRTKSHEREASNEEPQTKN